MEARERRRPPPATPPPEFRLKVLVLLPSEALEIAVGGIIGGADSPYISSFSATSSSPSSPSSMFSTARYALLLIQFPEGGEAGGVEP
jgi:hypothetical protein